MDLDQLNEGRPEDEQQELLEEFERKRLARSLAVPTEDYRVRRRLQAYNQPQTLFAEGPAERRDRLRETMSKVLQEQGQDALIVSDEDDEEEDESEDSDASEEDLVDEMVGAESEETVGSAEAELDVPVTQRKKMKLDWYTRLKTYTTYASQIGDDRPLSTCLFSPNSKVLATASFSGLVKLWSIPNCEHLITLKGHSGRASGLAFHPGSTLTQSPNAVNLATSALDGKINLHSFTSDVPIATLEGHLLRVPKLAFHPSGKFLGSASYDHTWRLWDLETEQELLLQEGHSREVFAIGFQGDGSLVATAGLDQIGRVWDLRSGRSIMVMQGHVGPIHCLDWSPNGHLIATGSADNQVRIWDVRMAKCSYVIPAHTSVVSQVRFWHANDGFEADYSKRDKDWTFTTEPPAGAGSQVNGSKSSEYRKRSWRLIRPMEIIIKLDRRGGESGDEGGNRMMDSDDEDIHFDPAVVKDHEGFEKDAPSLRRHLLTGGHLLTSSYDGHCKIFTEGDWKPIKSLSGLEGKVMSSDCSADGNFIATASYDRTFKLYGLDSLAL
ncbi:WD40-repeat-containing domain protein [Chytridium lagenaria]|nr:WD40-repeat-containing domain protein [Chytridium lagenaria]